MIERLIGFKPGTRFLIGTAVIVLGALAVELYADKQGLSYKDIIVVLGALIAGVIIFGGERGIRFGLVLWVLTLALGYRTVEWTSNLRIHPSEILIWLLLACILVQRQLASSSRLSLPWWLWLLVPFWVLAWWPLIFGDAQWDKMLNEFRDFLLLVPLMIVALFVLQRDSYWRPLLLAFFLVGSWIAFMGVTEYWFPEVTKLFPAFIKDVKPGLTDEGFMRGQFSFWGGSQATFICALALPSAIILARWWSKWLQRTAIIAASVLQMVAIYIGGYRSIWALLLLQGLMACLFGFKKHGLVIAALCLVVAVGGYQFIPKTDERVRSGIAALKGSPIDHSAQDRKDRALEALNVSIEAPFGSGWSSAGWVHSDFLQVTANLGLIAGLIFLVGYLYTLSRLARQTLMRLRSTEGELGLTLLLIFVGAGGLLAFQGVEVLPQMALPVWFAWVLVEIWLRQSAAAKELAYSYAPANFYPAADFQ